MINQSPGLNLYACSGDRARHFSNRRDIYQVVKVDHENRTITVTGQMHSRQYDY